jgi:hypothetical protein
MLGNAIMARAEAHMSTQRLSKEQLAELKALRDEMRYVVANLVLSILRTLSDLRFSGGDLHRNMDSILIGLAVCVAEHEGRAMSPYKIAQYLGMPRSTVVRKTGEMLKSGYLQREGRGLIITKDWLEGPNATLVARQIFATLQAVRRLTDDVNDDTIALLRQIDPSLLSERSGMDT